MSQRITSPPNIGLPVSLEPCDIADQGFGEKWTRNSSTTSLDNFSDGSTLGKQSDLEGGLGKQSLQEHKSTLGLWRTWIYFIFHVFWRRPKTSCKENDNSAAFERGYKLFRYPSYEEATCGWPQVASFMDSCDNFGIYRKFGKSQSRILITYMTEITKLEMELEKLDEEDSRSEDSMYRLKSVYHREDLDAPHRKKRDLVALLELKLLKYNALLLQYQKVKALPQTPERDHNSVFRWIWKNQPLDEGEYDWIFHPEDFVSLVPPRRDSFEDFIRSHIELRPISWLKKYLITHKQLHRTNDPSVQLFSVERVKFFARLLVVFLAVLILLIPVILFLLTPMSRGCMAVVVLAFVFVFSIMMSLLTDAGIQEIFVGTSTYCAVIVVFLGNLQNSRA